MTRLDKKKTQINMHFLDNGEILTGTCHKTTPNRFHVNSQNSNKTRIIGLNHDLILNRVTR